MKFNYQAITIVTMLFRSNINTMNIRIGIVMEITKYQGPTNTKIYNKNHKEWVSSFTNLGSTFSSTTKSIVLPTTPYKRITLIVKFHQQWINIANMNSLSTDIIRSTKSPYHLLSYQLKKISTLSRRLKKSRLKICQVRERSR